jgi:hypothetical protein
VKEIVGYVGQIEGTWAVRVTKGRKMGYNSPSQWELRILKMATFRNLASGWYEYSVDGS